MNPLAHFYSTVAHQQTMNSTKQTQQYENKEAMPYFTGGIKQANIGEEQRKEK